MTHQKALAQLIEKLEARLEDAERQVELADNTLLAPYERGRRSAIEHALADARVLNLIADDQRVQVA